MPTITEVVPYNPEWPQQFAEERVRVHNALGSHCIEVRHIGSTSVPGLAAKPIIDVLPIVKSLASIDYKNLEELGYEVYGEFGIPFHVFAKKRGEPMYHMHIWEDGNPEIEKHRLFLDYLRGNPAEAKRYENLKKDLALKYRHDRPSYTKGKDRLIQELIEKSGFRGMVLSNPLHDREWEACHRITKEQVFEPQHIAYDPNHPTFTAENHHRFVLTKITKVVSVAHIEFLEDGYAILRILATDEGAKNNGYGSHMLDQMERWVKKEGRHKLYVHVNPKALHFYKKRGYLPLEFNEASINSNAIKLGKTLK